MPTTRLPARIHLDPRTASGADLDLCAQRVRLRRRLSTAEGDDSLRARVVELWHPDWYREDPARPGERIYRGPPESHQHRR